MFRFICSVVLWGGRGAANNYHWPVWGALAVFQPHWVCPHSRRVCIPHLHCSGFRLLYRERALSCVHFPGLSRSGSGFQVLHKDAHSVGPAFCAFPSRSSSGDQELDERNLPGCGAPYSFHSPSLSFQAHPASCLFCGADLWLRPFQQMSTIQNLKKCLVRNGKPVCGLVGDASLWGHVCPFPLPPASCLQRRGSQPASSSLVLLSSLFCEGAGSVLG